MAATDPDLKEIVDAALDRDAAERMAFLAEMCRGDRALLARARKALESRVPGSTTWLIQSPGAEPAEGPELASTLKALPAPRLDQVAAAEGIARTPHVRRDGDVHGSLGPYRIIAKIGEGGMGVVYRAHDDRLRRDVAVKVLLTDAARDDDLVARFDREARAVAALSHPNIVAIHDVGRVEETPFIVMELLEGHSLREVLKSGRLPAEKAIDYALQVCLGLAAAHDKGIVHRDLKPGNIFVTTGGHLKLLDFGLAKEFASEAEGRNAHARSLSFATPSDRLMGTPEYMSPEQVRTGKATRQSDIFSFGVVLYEMLSGRSPFKKASAADCMVAVISEDPLDRWGREQLSPSLLRIVTRCLDKSPDQRFQSASDLAFALDAVERGEARSEPAIEPPLFATIQENAGSAPADGSERPGVFGAAMVQSAHRPLLIRLGVVLGVVLVLAGVVYQTSTDEEPARTTVARPEFSDPDLSARPPDPQPDDGTTPVPASSSPGARNAADARSEAGRVAARAVSPASSAAPPAAFGEPGSSLPAAPPAVDGVDQYLARANGAHARQDLLSSLEIVEAGLRQYATDPALLGLLIDLEADARRRANAAFEQSVRANGDDAEHYLQRGNARFEEARVSGIDGRQGDAVRAYADAEHLFTVAAAPVAVAAAAPGVDAVEREDRLAILETLQRYARAYERESTVELKSVFPSMTAVELSAVERNFLDWESIELDIVLQGMSVSGARAQVQASQTQTIIPVVGATRRAENQLLLLLEKRDVGFGSAWTISTLRQFP